MKRISLSGNLLFLSNVEIGTNKKPTESLRSCSRILRDLVSQKDIQIIVITGKITSDKVQNKATVVLEFFRILVSMGIRSYVMDSPDSVFLKVVEWAKHVITDVVEGIIELYLDQEKANSVFLTLDMKSGSTKDDAKSVTECYNLAREFRSQNNIETVPWIFFGFPDMSFVCRTFFVGSCGRFNADEILHQCLIVAPGDRVQVEVICC